MIMLTKRRLFTLISLFIEHGADLSLTPRQLVDNFRIWLNSHYPEEKDIDKFTVTYIIVLLDPVFKEIIRE